MDKLEFGYSHGYTAALLRLKETISPELYKDLRRHNRRLTIKELSAMIDCMIESREKLRDNPFAFVRCNNATEKGWEVYEPCK